MTSLGASFILDGHIGTEDVILLIIFWANKGYLSINDICKMGTDELEFIKLKDSDSSMKLYGKRKFYELFNGKSSVKSVDLNGKFYTNLSKVKTELENTFKLPSTSAFSQKNDSKIRQQNFAIFCVIPVILFFNRISMFSLPKMNLL